MSKTYTPRTDWLPREWFGACLEHGTLCIQRCADCGRWRHPPRRFCPGCASTAATFEPVSGAGRVVSWVVSHRSLDPGWQSEAPYPTLVVELDEGPRVVAATRMSPGEVAAGRGVTITTEARGDDFVLLWADPTDS